MKFEELYEEGKLVGFSMLPDDDSDLWFLTQKLKIVKHCGLDDCPIKVLKLQKTR